MVQAREDIRPASSKRARAGNVKTSQRAAAGKFIAVRAGEDIAMVPVSKARFASIVTDKRTLGKLISGYADTAAKAKQTGRAFQITYRVTPSGKAETVSETLADQAAQKPLDAAIARAKVRGATKVTNILKGADMLTARDFGHLIGASHETVNAKRKRFEVLGLEGATRGVKYPRWQVTDDGMPLPGLSRLFATLGKQPWTVYRFLLMEQAELGGRSPLDALKSGQVEAVVGLADNLTFGQFS